MTEGENIVKLEDFKKALGTQAESFTDAELKRHYELSARLARALFDDWQRALKARARNNKQESGVVK